MASTISFTPINDGAFYTLAQLNELFRQVALVLNAKLDVALNQQTEFVFTTTDQVFVSTEPVILNDPESTVLSGTFGANFKRFRNLKPGTASQDAITVAQAREIVA